jgi:hypothetical protein
MTQVKNITDKESINPMWILCDNESMVDIIKNKNMVTNIQNPNNPIEITGIGGEPIRVNKVGDLLGYGTVYHHPSVAANILSFHKIIKRFKSVKYDNGVKDAFIVTRDDGSTMEFIPSKEGLYHYDFSSSKKRRKEIEQKLKEEKTMVIRTVEEVKRNFTKRELENAEEARRLYVIMGRPSQKIFEKMITSGKLINYSVTVQDSRNAITIYGTDLGVLKGKTTRRKTEHVSFDINKKPKPVNIILSIDLMYFTGLTFLTTVSRIIRFITATLLVDRKKENNI